uniref:Uncharacterized protein n=1 Tax=Anguilla anguilla TaxID=7936 RepID=A0A0E9Q8W3_ANGAN
MVSPQIKVAKLQKCNFYFVPLANFFYSCAVLSHRSLQSVEC